MKIRKTLIFAMIFLGLISWVSAQENFLLEDLNPNSATYGKKVGPAYYYGNVCVVFFGHET
jgi:hypothetical protein